MRRWRKLLTFWTTWVSAFAVSGLSCAPVGEPDDDSNGTGVPGYIGSAACRACHSSLGDPHAIHGHSQALKMVEGTAPAYPDIAESAGVPDPPPGFDWPDIRYLIGGYSKAASFVDRDGFLLTDGEDGPPVQYHLAHAVSDTPAAFIPLTSTIARTPYVYDCFRCHATGPLTLVESGGRRQEGLAGIEGRWAEEGVQCEACHGPGALHIINPSAGNITVDSSPSACDRCHIGTERSPAIAASHGFIVGNQQTKELAASPHAAFSCTVCHNPHASVLFDPAKGIRNDCVNCHTAQNMAQHQGRIYVLGDYVETLTCQSCHMPLAGSNAVTALIPVPADGAGRIGDTRSHVMYIDTVERDFNHMLADDGQSVKLDARGKAAVTVDFVCQRCHHGQGNAFPLTLGGAATVADGIHEGP